MTPRLLYAIAAIAAVSAFAADARRDITLTSGETLTSARIVAIGKETASIVYAAGATSVPLDLVPLDVLARAHMELEATAAERAQKQSEISKRAAEQSAFDRAQREDELRVRLAMASVREQVQEGRPPEVRQLPAKIAADVAKLKAALPRHPNASSQDPAVRDCIGKYSRAFSHITADTISQNARWIRDHIAADIAACKQTLASTKKSLLGEKTATSAMRAAAEANAKWLNALLAHVERFESLAQTRG